MDRLQLSEDGPTSGLPAQKAEVNVHLPARAPPRGGPRPRPPRRAAPRRPMMGTSAAIVVAAAALTAALGGAVASAAVRPATVTAFTWHKLTLRNGWVSSQSSYGTGDPAWAVKNGVVYLSGSLHQASGNGSSFAVLPKAARPAGRQYFAIYTNSYTTGILLVKPDGTVFVSSSPQANATAYTSLAGVSFPAAATTLHKLTLRNGWVSEQSAYHSGNPSYWVRSGIVHLSGAMNRPAGDSDIFSALPAADKTSGNVFRTVYTAFVSTGTLTTDHQGRLAVVGYAIVGGVVYLSGALTQASPGSPAFAVLPKARIRQFLDIGTGIPTANNTHEVAQSVAPEARVVYVDNDPMVLAHARALLTSAPPGATSYLDADLRDTETILSAAAYWISGSRSRYFSSASCSSSLTRTVRGRSSPGWWRQSRQAAGWQSSTQPATYWQIRSGRRHAASAPARPARRRCAVAPRSHDSSTGCISWTPAWCRSTGGGQARPRPMTVNKWPGTQDLHASHEQPDRIDRHARSPWLHHSRASTLSAVTRVTAAIGVIRVCRDERAPCVVGRPVPGGETALASLA
jgi:hypothetical protein